VVFTSVSERVSELPEFASVPASLGIRQFVTLRFPQRQVYQPFNALWCFSTRRCMRSSGTTHTVAGVLADYVIRMAFVLCNCAWQQLRPAIPAFARKYRVAVFGCHEAWPKAQQFRQQFKTRLPVDERSRRSHLARIHRNGRSRCASRRNWH